MLVMIALLIASRGWWVAIHQHASMWLISTGALEVLTLGLGLHLILIVPFFHGRSVGRPAAGERSKEHKRSVGFP
jgi:hypothetical protein